ncbi:hypothetical protein MPL1032_190126 [Mesorhizobium plurifarium]|uniref:Uncharacterized protein n=1 Tax=Mesorhizobium plurifarium TaxID=69974 RepID=A0A0K2VVK3_MESPL|nr:hypothetical protein MPL1032_190126 [Mesorhizobium plurifarium]
MTKTTFGATFSDGVTIKRNSNRDYEAAFIKRVQGPNGTYEVAGFSRSRALAERALATEVNRTAKFAQTARGAGHTVIFSEVADTFRL